MAIAVVENLLLTQRQFLALRHPQLPLDQIDTVDELGHRVLDLQTRVHFQKIELPVARQHELDGAGTDVVHRLGGGDSGGTHLQAQRVIDRRARGFLDHLLVATLHRAIAFAKVHDIAVAVAEYLDLDVAGVHHRLLDQELAGTKGVLGLAARRADVLQQRRLLEHQAHAAATATGGRLDHDWQAGLLGLVDQGVVVLVVALIARHAGHARRDHADLRGALVAHRLDGSRVRADEDQAGVLHRLREGLALGKETVAGMDRLRAAGLRRCDDLLDDEVGVLRRRRADVHRLIGLAHMQALRIGIRIDSDGLVARLLRAADDPQRDLATVGNQHLVETLAHWRLSINSLIAPISARASA